jgi:chromosome segregation ATPase
VQQARALSEQLAALAAQNPQDVAAAQAAQKAGEALQVLVADVTERQQKAAAALKSAQDELAAAQGALEQLNNELAAAPARLEQAKAAEAAAAQPPLLETRAKVSALQAEYDALRPPAQ